MHVLLCKLPKIRQGSVTLPYYTRKNSSYRLASVGNKSRIVLIDNSFNLKQHSGCLRIEQHYFHLLLQWIDNEANHHLRYAALPSSTKSKPEHPQIISKISTPIQSQALSFVFVKTENMKTAFLLKNKKHCMLSNIGTKGKNIRQIIKKVGV